jgi:2,3-dihydroxybenzoate decarboxylase
VKLVALEEAFWYDKLATDGTPLSRVPVKPEVIAGWRRKLADFTEYRLPEVDKHGIDKASAVADRSRHQRGSLCRLR